MTASVNGADGLTGQKGNEDDEVHFLYNMYVYDDVWLHTAGIPI